MLFNLRPAIIKKLKALRIRYKSDSLICGSCNAKISKKQITPVSNDNDSSETDEPTESVIQGRLDVDNKNFNMGLKAIHQSPISNRKLRSNAYKQNKFDSITRSMKETVFSGVVDSSEEMVNQLKDKFKEAQSQQEKCLILSVLPNSWTVQKIVDEFKVTTHMAKKVKSLVKEKGILSVPDGRMPTTSLDETTRVLVQEFYNDDEISRACPGKKE